MLVIDHEDVTKFCESHSVMLYGHLNCLTVQKHFLSPLKMVFCVFASFID